jgi:hypothetical protein
MSDKEGFLKQMPSGRWAIDARRVLLILSMAK